MVVKKETISTEFLIQTIASIQSALSSIDKESTAKTEALSAVLENINSMAETMKHFRDSNTTDSAKIAELVGLIKTLEAHLDGADTDLKEVKYAIQKLNENVLELKTVKNTKEDVEQRQAEEDKKKSEEPKKLNLFGLFKKAVEILSNLKTILLVVLIIVLLIASLIYGPSVLQTFFEIFKATSGS